MGVGKPLLAIKPVVPCQERYWILARVCSQECMGASNWSARSREPGTKSVALIIGSVGDYRY